MRFGKKFLSALLIVVLCLTVAPFDSFIECFSCQASASSNNVCISSLTPTAFDRYTGNEGDSFFYNLNKQGLADKNNNYYRCGNIGVDETVYKNGFEVWIARWNYSQEISWAAITYDIDGAYKTLSGSTGLIKSYNTTNFDTTVYFYGDEQLLYSQVLTNDNFKFDFNIDVSGVDKLKILVQDNVAVKGGTALALYDLFFDATKTTENTSGTMASGTCGDNLTWVLYNDGELVISGTGEMWNYSLTVEPWYEYRDLIEELTIEYGVSSIGYRAFNNCKNLKNLQISNSVTIIYGEAFSFCTSLEEITVPDSVTVLGDSAFEGCKSLLMINLSENITNIDSLTFRDCDSLTNITIPFNVTNIGFWSFYDCDNLTSVSIHNKVTSIYKSAFTYCDSLEIVYYSGTEEQWNNIDIGVDNECLTNANIIFNSEITPETPTIPEVPDNPDVIPETPFSSYFADYLKDYTLKTANVDMPCEALIAAGGMPSLTWNTVVESIKSLTNFKLGIDEKGYYEAILLDLLANTVTSVDYDKVITETTKEMANMLTNYLVDKNVDVTKEKLDSLDLKNLQDNLQDYFTASNIQITKECFDALIDGTESTAECLDKISTYAIAMQEGQHLVSALELMSEHSDYQPLTDCLNEVATLMNASPEEMAKTVAKKGVAAKTSQVVGDYILGVIKNIFPLETIKDIINIADYGCNLIFPTSTTSEQMYRIYTLYHIEDVAKASFKTASNNYNSADTIANAENVVSCYDMIVRVYEHQIAECNALAELLYTKGLLNAVNNFFSTNSSYDYQNALDWVDSYNVDLDVIKNYKQSAHEERGLSLGLLQPVRFIGIADGKVMGYSEQFVETGSNVTVPNYTILKQNKFLENLGTFEGWFYDLDCTIPVWATSIQVNKPLVLYSKISTKNAKQLQIKCPVNVEIYDDNNNVLLKIENDVLVQNSADFVVIIEGTQKCVLLPCDENYNIKLSATDSGTMNYSVTEIENGAYVRRYNFYDVSLYSGQEFSGNIESGLNVAQSDYALTTKTIENKTAEITPNEVIEKSEMQKLNISVNCVGNGIVSGNMLVTQGDYCVLEAIPNEDSDFDGWYCDNELLSSEKYFSFIVKENMSLTAVFSGDDTHEHSFGEWVVVKAPTATEEGIEECVCSVCGGKETRTIEKLNYIVGDVNGDGKITAADARIVLRISAKLDSMENYNLPLEAFDVTGDGKITAADARKVLRISAKLEK